MLRRAIAWGTIARGTIPTGTTGTTGTTITTITTAGFGIRSAVNRNIGVGTIRATNSRSTDRGTKGSELLKARPTSRKGNRLAGRLHENHGSRRLKERRARDEQKSRLLVVLGVEATAHEQRAQYECRHNK
jgi:hypothetical protein